MKAILALLAMGTFLISLRGEDRLAAARTYLDEHRVYRPVFVPSADYLSLRAKMIESYHDGGSELLQRMGEI